MSGQTSLDIGDALNFGFFGRIWTLAILGIVARSRLSLGLSLMEIGQDTLIVLLRNVIWDTFHAEDLDVKPGSVGQGIIDCGEILLMDLTHVNTQASCGVQPSAASFALEVLCFLMVDQNFQIIEVALAVIAPGSREDLFNIGAMGLPLGHRTRCERLTDAIGFRSEMG